VNASGTTLADGGAWWSFTTSGSPPGGFGKGTPANGANGVTSSPTLTWGASTGATGYEYCLDTTANAACDTSWTTAATASAALGGLTPATTYSWQVRAVNGSGTTLADGGAWWSFTTQAAPSGGWLDPAWTYRRAIAMTNGSGAPLTNYQVAVTLDSSSFDFTHAQSDGRDLRVTDATGTTLLPLWVEVWDAAALRATVWVKVPNVPAAGTTLYLYSGNAAAPTASNAAATLDGYDGFEALAVGGAPTAGTGVTWSGSGGGVAAVSSPARQGTRSLQPTNFTLTTGTFAALPRGTIGGWLRRQSLSAGDTEIYLYGNGTLLATLGLGGSGRLHYWDGTFHDTSVSWTANTWYFVTATFDAGQQRFTFTAYDAALRPLVTVPNIALAANVPSINSVLLYSSSAFAGTAFVDDFRALRWTGTETTITLGAEQTR
jgi:hypothetical protein